MDYKICKNCVMDTSDSKITFNENGVCDHCGRHIIADRMKDQADKR